MHVVTKYIAIAAAAAALGVPEPATADPVFPIVIAGDICFDAYGYCAPVTFTLHEDNVMTSDLGYTGAWGYNGARERLTMLFDDGIGKITAWRAGDCFDGIFGLVGFGIAGSYTGCVIPS